MKYILLYTLWIFQYTIKSEVHELKN